MRCREALAWGLEELAPGPEAAEFLARTLDARDENSGAFGVKYGSLIVRHFLFPSASICPFCPQSVLNSPRRPSICPQSAPTSFDPSPQSVLASFDPFPTPHLGRMVTPGLAPLPSLPPLLKDRLRTEGAD